LAQFDVFRNPSSRTRWQLPLLLDVQSDLLRQSTRRVVVPLARAHEVAELDRTLNPTFDIEGVRYALLPTDIAPIPARQLGEAMTSLVDEGETILAAMDLLLARR
jgi:toxin CcdB